VYGVAVAVGVNALVQAQNLIKLTEQMIRQLVTFLPSNHYLALFLNLPQRSWTRPKLTWVDLAFAFLLRQLFRFVIGLWVIGIKLRWTGIGLPSSVASLYIPFEPLRHFSNA